MAITHTEVGAQTLRFTLRDGATMFFFTFRHDGPIPDEIDAQQQLLLEHMRGVGWEVPQILTRLPEARTFYLDKASQIRMPTWSRGRVVLDGDAAACPSLLAGQGSALAMIEGYVLAAELARNGTDYAAAFDAYERQLAPMVRDKQDAALGTASIFAPRNRRQLLFRNGMFKFDVAALREPTGDRTSLAGSNRTALSPAYHPEGHGRVQDQQARFRWHPLRC